MGKRADIRWLAKPEEHDYPAARSYLGLDLRRCGRARAGAKAPARARLAIQGEGHLPRVGPVAAGREQRARGEGPQENQERQELAPLLLVRDRQNGKVVIADGYHRLCAVYSFDEDALIPCKIA